MSEEKTFIERHFTCVECSQYVPDATNISKGETKSNCFCGELFSHHVSKDSSKQKTDVTVWSEKNLIRLQPTNAFGRLKHFDGTESNPMLCKYLRFGQNDNVDDIINLFELHWGVFDKQLKTVVLSFIGMPESSADERLYKKIEQAISDTAKIIDLIILSSGVDCPMTRDIGKIVTSINRMLIAEGSKTIRFIGVLPWGSIVQKECLIQHGAIAFYEARKASQLDGYSQICPYLTHALLLDNGHRRKSNVLDCNEFRWRLESKIAYEQSIKVLTLLWNGTAGSITETETRINRGIPVVCLYGTLGAADVIIEVKNMHEKYLDTFEQFSPEETVEIYGLLEKLQNDINIEVAYADLVRLFIDHRRLFAFDIFSQTRASKTIFDAFAKYRFTAGEFLEFALRWNRVDGLAKLDESYLSTIPQSRRNYLFASALLTDRHTFVPVIFKIGVHLNDIVTLELLHKLYNDAPRVNDLLRLLHAAEIVAHREFGAATSNRDETVPEYRSCPLRQRFDREVRCCPSVITLHDIHCFIRKALGNFDCPDYFCDLKKRNKEDLMKNPLTNPLLHLFLWAVLVDSHQMAKALVGLSAVPATLANMGAKLNRYMVSLFPASDRESRQILTQQAACFESFSFSK